ncbi:MAG: hypothetical protein JNJ85_10260 [Candidatus Kapabacteria bacterium]|nr:hypothetical protein [Candidatus Kapabacteria bacterium]
MKALRIISHILLAVVLMCTTEGIPIALHYCSGEIESVEVFSFSSTCQGEGCDDTENPDDGCCKNTVEIHQFAYDATVQNIISIDTHVVPDIVPVIFSEQLLVCSDLQVYTPTNQTGVPLPQRRQSLLCTYRI